MINVQNTQGENIRCKAASDSNARIQQREMAMSDNIAELTFIYNLVVFNYSIVLFRINNIFNFSCNPWLCHFFRWWFLPQNAYLDSLNGERDEGAGLTYFIKRLDSGRVKESAECCFKMVRYWDMLLCALLHNTRKAYVQMGWAFRKVLGRMAIVAKRFERHSKITLLMQMG